MRQLYTKRCDIIVLPNLTKFSSYQKIDLSYLYVSNNIRSSCYRNLMFVLCLRNPTTTGTSVLALRFNGGVIVAADTLGSYGSMAMFRDCDRVMRVNDSTVLGGGGDYADFQFIMNAVQERV